VSLVREPAPERLAPERAPEHRAADEVDTHGLHVAERAAWSVVWLAVLTEGVSVWGFWWSSPFAVVLAPLLVLAGLAGLTATWVARTPRTPALQICAFGAVMTSVLFPQAIIIHTRIFYSTDSAAFDQASARLLLHGHNPYTASLSSAAGLLSAPGRLWTYTVSGGHIVHASYPAGSFLLEIPAMALGLNHMVVDWNDLFAWMVCAALFFVLLPVSLRWLAGLLALTPIFIGMFSSGGTDAAFMPFLVLAVWRWDRFGRADARIARWIGPVALGLACSIKQTPWFCVPFLASGIAMEARLGGRPSLRPMLRYLGIVAGTFLAVNLPFLVWAPAAWLRGTLLPFVGGLIADGQGLVTIATHGVSGGANLTMLSVASLLALLALILAWITWYPTLKRVWLLILPVVFFLSPRSLSSYLVDLIPIAVVAAVTVHSAPGVQSSPLVPRRLSTLLLYLAGAGAAVIVCLAFVTHPLHITVDGVTASTSGSRVEAVTITVKNLTGAPEKPHFLVNPGEGIDGFWTIPGDRDLVLGPHASTTVTLHAPIGTPAPQHGAHWLVEAYTTSPDAITTSALQVWHGFR